MGLFDNKKQSEIFVTTREEKNPDPKKENQQANILYHGNDEQLSIEIGYEAANAEARKNKSFMIQKNDGSIETRDFRYEFFDKEELGRPFNTSAKSQLDD